MVETLCNWLWIFVRFIWQKLLLNDFNGILGCSQDFLQNVAPFGTESFPTGVSFAVLSRRQCKTTEIVFKSDITRSAKATSVQKAKQIAITLFYSSVQEKVFHYAAPCEILLNRRHISGLGSLRWLF